MKGEPGEIIDRRFRLVKRIEEGHFGVVFEALDTTEGDAVALKWSHPEAARDPTAKAFRLAYPDQVKDRCRLDGYAQMQIHHPNVNQVRWVGDADRWPYIVSDLQPGSLEDELRAKRGRRLEPGEAVGIAMQVCEALEAALKARVYHRDLCPSNILMAKDGTAKVTDFGIGKSFYLLSPSGTGFDQRIGRPEYLPPERLEENAPPLDEKGHRLADIYSLGVTLFELLTGIVPFPGGSRERVFDQQREARRRGRLPSVRHHVTELPEELDRVVQTAIALEPSQRFQTAREFRESLEELGHPGPPDPPPNEARREPQGAWILGVRLPEPLLWFYPSLLGLLGWAVMLWGFLLGERLQGGDFALQVVGGIIVALAFFANLLNLRQARGWSPVQVARVFLIACQLALLVAAVLNIPTGMGTSVKDAYWSTLWATLAAELLALMARGVVELWRR